MDKHSSNSRARFEFLKVFVERIIFLVYYSYILGLLGSKMKKQYDFQTVRKCLLFALADRLKRVVGVKIHNWLFCVFGLDRLRGLKVSKLRCEAL